MGGNWARTGMPTPTTSNSIYNVANQLTSWNGATLTYDANGNLTSDGVNNYTWNARNQLISVAAVNGGTTLATFQYDPFGRRIQNSVGNQVLYDGANSVQELSSSTPVTNWLTGGVDEFFSRAGSTGTFYPLTDALGSTLALTDSTGAVQTQYTYDPFGNTSVSGTSTGNTFQYTGRENDGTGLYYYRARYYSPVYQRFISQDPARSASGGLNLYGYIGESPANFRDPLGMFRIDPNFPVSCLSALKHAIDIVRRAAEKNPKCNCQFKQMGEGKSLLDLLNSPDITIHYDPVQQPATAPETGTLAEYTDSRDTHDIWVEPYGCSMGRWTMASYLVHELTHIALTPGPGQEDTAEQVKVNCSFPIQVLTPSITVRP